MSLAYCMQGRPFSFNNLDSSLCLLRCLTSDRPGQLLGHGQLVGQGQLVGRGKRVGQGQRPACWPWPACPFQETGRNSTGPSATSHVAQTIPPAATGRRPPKRHPATGLAKKDYTLFMGSLHFFHEVSSFSMNFHIFFARVSFVFPLFFLTFTSCIFIS